MEMTTVSAIVAAFATLSGIIYKLRYDRGKLKADTESVTVTTALAVVDSLGKRLENQDARFTAIEKKLADAEARVDRVTRENLRLTLEIERLTHENIELHREISELRSRAP